MDSYRDEAEGELGPIGEGREAMARVVLRPAIRFSGERIPSEEEVGALHREAHRLCYIANSVRTEVTVEPVQPS